MENEEPADDGAGVQSVEAMETVTTPPDEMVAEEIQENELFAAIQKNPSSSGSASTSSSSGDIASKMHLQEPVKKGRLTPMAKQRAEMHKTMLSLIERNSRATSENEDDELDLSFASLAMRIRRNFTMSQREAIHTEIINLVNTAIGNKERGMPILTPSPRFQAFQGQQQVEPQVQVQVQPPQMQMQMQNPNMQPPQMQPAPQMISYSGDQNDGGFMDLLNSSKCISA